MRKKKKQTKCMENPELTYSEGETPILPTA